jgi:hypothetical protein
MFLLIDRHDGTGVVEDHEAGARRSLVERANVLCHVSLRADLDGARRL